LPLPVRLPFLGSRRQRQAPLLQLAEQLLVGPRGEPLGQGLGNLAADAEKALFLVKLKR